jgi:hypothetical protein
MQPAQQAQGGNQQQAQPQRPGFMRMILIYFGINWIIGQFTGKGQANIPPSAFKNVFADGEPVVIL